MKQAALTVAEAVRLLAEDLLECLESDPWKAAGPLRRRSVALLESVARRHPSRS